MAVQMKQVFISSTYIDLKKERKAVECALRRVKLSVAGMEYFNPDGKESWDQIKEAIDESDYYVLIVGKRYGDMTNLDSEELSYTEKEFKYAYGRWEKKKIMVLPFIIEEGVKTKDYDEAEINRNALKKFKKGLLDKLYCGKWKDKNDLATKVLASIYIQEICNKHSGSEEDLQSKVNVLDLSKQVVREMGIRKFGESIKEKGIEINELKIDRRQYFEIIENEQRYICQVNVRSKTNLLTLSVEQDIEPLERISTEMKVKPLIAFLYLKYNDEEFEIEYFCCEMEKITSHINGNKTYNFPFREYFIDKTVKRNNLPDEFLL